MPPLEIGCTAKRPLSWWRDLWRFQPLVVRSVKTAPVVVAYVLISTVISTVSDQLDRILSIPDALALLCLMCTAVYETWAELSGEAREEHRLDYRRLGSVFGANWIYSLLVLIGGVCLLAPGIYVLISASLAIVYICVEGKSATTALQASRTLVQGNFKKACTYLVPPVLVGAAGCFALLTLAEMIVEAFFGDDKSISNALGALAGLALQWLMLSMVPMQVRLYRELKEQKGELIPITKKHAWDS